MYEIMDRERRREIADMRMRSGYREKSRPDSVGEINSGVSLLFRCFLSFALFLSGIVFPGIPENKIPEELKEIPEFISVNYTMEDVTDLMDGIME